MLVLTRKAGEEIHIGNNIVISICRIRGQRTQLGIEAPPEVAIRRKVRRYEDSAQTVQKELTPHRCRLLDERSSRARL
jgi:carbon storage regulator CsrA